MTNRPSSYDADGSRFPQLQKRLEVVLRSVLLVSVYFGFAAVFYTSLSLVYRALT
jgi:hypothetical protein